MDPEGSEDRRTGKTGRRCSRLRLTGRYSPERRTALIFDEGTLTGFCVSKGSEGAGLVEIPVEIIRSVVALPTQILQVRINHANSQSELNRIHAETIELQTKLIRFEQGDKAALSKSGSGEFRAFQSKDPAGQYRIGGAV